MEFNFLNSIFCIVCTGIIFAAIDNKIKQLESYINKKNDDVVILNKYEYEILINAIKSKRLTKHKNA